MKRKVLCTIMAAMMVLSACGSKAPEQPSESENKQTEIADSETEGNQAGDTQSEGTQAEDTQKEASGEEDSQKADPAQTEASGQKAASGSKVTIPAGSTIYPKGNKPGEKLFCFSYENQNLEVGYERVKDSYELLIDGIGQEEIFEMLPYAG